LRKRFPELEIGETAPTPVDGIVVVKAGGDNLYPTEDGHHAFIGSLVMPDGRLLPGYLSSDRLLAALGLKKTQS
jgi:hypothetical protein